MNNLIIALVPAAMLVVMVVLAARITYERLGNRAQQTPLASKTAAVSSEKLKQKEANEATMTDAERALFEDFVFTACMNAIRNRSQRFNEVNMALLWKMAHDARRSDPLEFILPSEDRDEELWRNAMHYGSNSLAIRGRVVGVQKRTGGERRDLSTSATQLANLGLHRPNVPAY